MYNLPQADNQNVKINDNRTTGGLFKKKSRHIYFAENLLYAISKLRIRVAPCYHF